MFRECHFQSRFLRLPRSRFPEEEDDAEGRWKDDEIANEANPQGLRGKAEEPKVQASRTRFVWYLTDVRTK